MQEASTLILTIAIPEIHLDIIQVPIQVPIVALPTEVLQLLQYLHQVAQEIVQVVDPLVEDLLVVAVEVAVNNKWL